MSEEYSLQQNCTCKDEGSVQKGSVGVGDYMFAWRYMARLKLIFLENWSWIHG